VSLPYDSQEFFQQVGRDYGRVDALVNNAAVQLTKSIEDTEPEEWDHVMANNVRAVYLAVRHALPLMNGGASVVNVASVHALASSTNISAYAASKGALLSLTRALAVELAPRGVRVNAVLPGATDTHMLRSGVRRGERGGLSEGEALAALGDRHPMGRVGAPGEIAHVIAFLADGHRSSFVTGQHLTVDGGALARLSTE
jgi:NAD(P)-dependent dehydrogenase (short-subunit alcohol dehydrogenase family)